MDSVSGQPVPHALVRLTGNSARATLTDSEGKFQWEGLAEGSVTLQAGKPGYLDNAGAGLFSGSVTSFQLGPNTVPAVLKLTPESVIVGQVSDENGEPLEGFSVSVLSRSPFDKRLYTVFPAQLHTAVTDDEGKFRIAGLHAGSYYLEARQNQAPVMHASEESSVPSGYPPVFFPGVRDVSSAARIKLLPGRAAQANFSLKRGPFVQLSGTVSGHAPQEQVSLMLWDSLGSPQNSEISFDVSTGRFHTKWIPPGVYTLTAQSAGHPSVDAIVDSSVAVYSSRHGLVRLQRSSFARLVLNASSSLSDLHLALQPSSDIPVIVHGLPGAGPLTDQTWKIFLQLVSRDREFPSPNFSASLEDPEKAHVSESMRMVFRGIAQGSYDLAIDSEPVGAFYIESATWGSTDLLRDDLVLDSSASISPIEIVVRDDGATLNGTVSSSDSLSTAQVVLLTRNRKRPQFVSVGSNGRFEVSGLAPGVYRVFAVDDSANFDYEDPASLAKISSKIQEITLAPKQSTSINLELATVGE